MLIAAICTGNTCRSPMLERFLHRAIEQRQLRHVSVMSAGVAANDGDPASLHAQQVISEYAMDLSKHRSRPISRVDVPRLDIMITMSERHAAILRQLGGDPQRIVIAGAESGGVPDPYGGSIDDYRRTAVVLEHVAEEIVEQIQQQRRH
ncbi:MAG: hypothetical protein EA401_03515 [Planctomycetota bacterium]|nr:MAG: hypothetical protein EA401_03515 [Planctomycetota bacterium]